jgi:predicted metal-dependent hydrolase
MATKTYELDNLGKVTIVKRSTNRHLRLTIAGDGTIKVSIPSWTPYKTGIDFAKSKSNWIKKERPNPIVLDNNQPIGRAHRLYFQPTIDIVKPKSRINENQIIISHSLQQNSTNKEVQLVATNASIKALRKQAESLLPQKLKILAENYSLPYNGIQIKQLSRRWGSCDQKNNIVLNLFLIQLPWELIDYVILHELTHTQHLNHSPIFWSKLETMVPDAKQLRKHLKNYPD